MAAGGGLFALGQKSRLELPAAFVYAGSAIGVALAGDLVTLFVFWELMAVGSTLVLWSNGSGKSYRASLRYLMIHLLGGMILFAGITGHIAQTGSVDFTRMALDSPAQWLILIGFLVNAGGAAAVGLAARRLSRSVVERHGVSVGVHDEGGGLRADARLSGHRAADLGRPLHGVLRHRLRAARERHAAHPGVLDRQPGRLHGGGHRHRHRDGAERRRCARLHAHHLQGTAADVGRLGAVHDEPAQMLRTRRPVPQHAGDHRFAESSARWRSRRFR